jgi:transposase
MRLEDLELLLMKAYSLDLRQRVVSAYGAGSVSIKQVAERFSVGETFVKKMLRQKREQGAVKPPAHGGGKQRTLSDKHVQALRQWLRIEPDLTLSELQERMLERKRKVVSVATLGKVLAEEKLTRKKNQSLRRKETTGNGRVSGGESKG